MRLLSPVVAPWALGAVLLLVWAGTDDRPAARAAAGSFSCTVASVHDGDTMTCQGGLRVRLSGIDARETDGSCAPGHPCASAPPEAATAKLEELALGQSFTCQDEGATYNRRAGFCRRADGLDLSCAMLASGTVVRWDRYWKGHRC